VASRRVSDLLSREGQYSDINMTPLIDVMLVLLIMFIVSIPSLTHSVKVDNQFPSKASPAVAEVIDLQIDFDGSLRWNGVLVDRSTLQRHVADQAAKLPQPDVHIAVDRFVKYQIVAQTLADLQSRGLRKLGFVNDGAGGR
jgi:biopolymer transport protein ExbD